MLTHIVCWKYKPGTPAEDIDEHIEKLHALQSLIPQVETLVVGRDILSLDRSFDTGLVATFADRDALEAYTVHSEHQKVAEMGKTLAAQAVSVDLLS